MRAFSRDYHLVVFRFRTKFLFGIDQQKSNYNYIAEKVSDCYIASNGAFILVYFIGGGGGGGCNFMLLCHGSLMNKE